MRIAVAFTLIVAAGWFAWIASEQTPSLPNKYAEIMQPAARAFATVAVAAAFTAGLLI